MLITIWWVISDGDTTSWIIGVPTVAATLWWSLRQPSASQPLPRLIGLIRFIPYFLWESLRGGIDVARIAFSARIAMRPHFCTYILNLPEGPARRVFINAVSLLPGTLSADIRDERLLVHRLRSGPEDNHDLQACERRVADLFGFSISPMKTRS
ncbi:multicomponent Na+:H+ antiporter subunit E [Modicisalibacter ilicicola DSM 19980]|uniref:Multicomponent Na+:H+ antiporter subunit E n=2 Tax=Modicisalibacter ilicicola TaxID=480814 RepID=A0A1M4ZPZ8_9GAMM|nr:multicomponent Na+:H+ antiporter subunit E [Halomonas ilicicola DSM 19980]